MIFWTTTKYLALTLLGSVSASPIILSERDSSVIIGYRTVSEQQAQNYKNAGNTLTPDPNQIGTQIGTGVYTTPGPGQWPGSQNSWYCTIYADPNQLNKVSKAWVPEQYNGKTLWYDNDAVNDYIKELESSWDPARTLRLSKVSGREDILQLAIPFNLLNQNGGAMNFKTTCSANLDDMGSYVVNYDDWQNNIKGDRG
ncbi:hypothetical protein F4819DRAFT_503496 [Hypoxylon fuscum]|nr:hypothetical protein F4819DRAFT_503496 [Hypoxylon fuscum]